MTAQAPLIVHVVYRFDFGGLENGLVNLINRMPRDRYRHAIVCLTTYSDFAKRIQRDDVRFIALHKRSGKDFGCYWRLARTLRELRPAVVHTRNLGTLDMQLVAALCGIRGRVHGEHGWDVYDLNGRNPKYLRLKRIVKRFVHRYVAMSRDLAEYVVRDVGVPIDRVHQIYSGVDGAKFRPRSENETPPWPEHFLPEGGIVFGTVGRQEPVKNPVGLVRAFASLVDAVPGGRRRLRLVLVGAGPMQDEVRQAVTSAGMTDLVWLPGGRDDVPALTRHMDVFVLPSLNEGISNTILEAMASGVPVVAARVGGNPEIVREGVTGALYASNDEAALARTLQEYVEQPERRLSQGRQARAVVEERHTLEAMVRDYLRVYDACLNRQFENQAAAAANGN